MSNSILPAAGNLDIVNANVRADKFNAATNIGVANTNPDFNFSVADKFHVNKDSTDPVSITGNVVASGIKISNLTIGPAFDFASGSNVGNVTANVIQFANATTGFTTTANVEIGGNIALTSNAQVTIGSNVLAEYTGPHPREPKEMPLKKFPEIAFADNQLDGDHTTNTYTQAGYTVMVSNQFIDSFNHREGWKVFNNKTSHWLDSWMTESSRYSTSTRLHIAGVSTTVSSVSYLGDYVQLEFPKKVSVSYVNIYASDRISRMPGVIVFAGSDNGTTWTLINSVTNNTHVPGESSVFNVNATQHYKYLRMIITEVTTADISQINDRVSIQEIQIYGYEESAPVGDLSLDTTLKSTFNSVRSNNYVMYFDGKDPDGTDPKNLVSGSSISLTNNNATYDASNDYWTLDGSTESNVTTGSLGFEGDAPHTVSMWVNASNVEDKKLFSIGSGYDKSFLKVDDTQIAANTWHNVTYAYQGEGGSKVTYVDGRKVEEAQVEDTFGEYPPFAMTDYETGGYRVSASDTFNEYFPYLAFNKLVNTQSDYWFAGDDIGGAGIDAYTGSVGGDHSYIGSDNLGGYTGIWIKLEMPHKLALSYIEFYRLNNLMIYTPRDFYVIGSNDDITWDLIHRETSTAADSTFTSGRPITTTSANNYNKYKYIAIVVDRTVNDNRLGIGEVKLYGHKEGDLTRFPEPTRVLKYPHVAMTGPGQRGYVASESSTHKPGGIPRPAHQAFNGVSNDDGWGSFDGGYFSATGLIDGAPTHPEVSEQGEWIQIELPHKLILDNFTLSVGTESGNDRDQARYPKEFKLYGYDGSSWAQIGSDYSTTKQTSAGQVTTYDVTTTTNYSKFLIIIKKTWSITGEFANLSTLTQIGEWELYGTQEDTGTPAIVGGPFAGKVANFRVYDKYLGDERIQEIYDAQKDAFGHKKSSMTFYKGRIGVGTTEPEGALTVVDEPHALAKFPARAVSADESYVEGDGQIKLSAADGSGYQAFDGLTSTSWTATPERHTRLSEEVDFGAWLKIQTPESMSRKKAEFESNPDWRQVGSEILTTNASEYLGRAVACSHDGTRIIAGGHAYNNFQGLARVYDWNGTTWENTTNTLIGTATGDKFGIYVAMSGDGSTIAVAARNEHVGGVADKGTVRVYYLSGTTWTVLPDSGPFTESGTGVVDTFVGQTSEAVMGGGGIHLSYDGRTLLITEPKSDSAGTDRGETRIFTYADGAWSQKGISINGTVNSEELGSGSDMTEDGNHIVIGTKGNAANPRVQVYEWNGTNAWQQKGSDLTYSGSDEFGPVVSISNDGNTVAVGIARADIAD